MKILVIGGTIFLGRVFVEQALARGHEITLFNRGKSNPDLFPDVEKIVGDRKESLDALKGRTWDAVFDPSGYFPRDVKATAEVLADNVKHYTFISSISVYKDYAQAGIDESYPVGQTDDLEATEINGENYGPLKALCEQTAAAIMPGRVLSVRAGLIVGRFDRSDRFTYWPHRVSKGGEFVAPMSPDYPVQFIDVRDLAGWCLDMIEKNVTGVFNATGPATPSTLGEIIDTTKQITGSDAEPVWMTPEFLSENDVQPWVELPFYLPPEEVNFAHMHDVSVKKALDSGMTFRSLEDTIKDTLAFVDTRPDDYEFKAGLKAEKEAEILNKWRESHS